MSWEAQVVAARRVAIAHKLAVVALSRRQSGRITPSPAATQAALAALAYGSLREKLHTANSQVA
jgi:hypothetical protein